MVNVPPEDTVPLQGGYCPPGQHMGQHMRQHMGQHMGQQVQFTTVNVNNSREMPKDHIIWSLLCFLYSNPCCLGLAALIHSIKARDRKVVGDVEGARSYGSTARTLNIISTVLACLTGLIVFIVIIVLSQQASHVASNYGNYYGRG